MSQKSVSMHLIDSNKETAYKNDSYIKNVPKVVYRPPNIKKTHFAPTESIQKSDTCWVLTESCPDKYWGASRSMPGLMGDVTDMDGRSIFCDSNELEPSGGI